MKNRKKILISLISLFTLFVFAATPVFAQFGFEYSTQLNMGTRDLRSTIMQIINILMGFLGILTIIIILFGVVKLGMGSEDAAAEGKKLVIGGFIGLGIVLSSYAIAYFVLNSLMKATK